MAVTWIDGTGDWFNPANWSGGAPNSSTPVVIDNAGTAQIFSHGAASNSARIGDTGAGAVTVGANGSWTTFGAGLTIAANAGSTGVVNQTGGLLTLSGGQIQFGGGSGTYNLNGGTLQIGGANAIGAGAGAYQFNLGGGTIQVLGSALTTNINATLTAGSTSTIDTNGFGATFSGVLSGGGALTKAGVGTLTLSGVNTYTGATLISAGTLQGAAAGAFSSASAFTVASGATLNLNGVGQIISIGSLAGSGLVNVGANYLLAGGDNSSTAFSGTVTTTTGVGEFIKAGSGTLTIDNATLGDTYVAKGALALTSGTTAVNYLAVGSGTSNVGAFSITGGTLTIPNAAGSAFQVGDFGGQGTVTQKGGTVHAGYSVNIGNQGGSGLYSISGGELDLSALLNTVGRNTGSNPGSTGELDIIGGLVDVAGTGGNAARLIIGYGGSTSAQSHGTVTQTGGTLRIHNDSTFNLSGLNSSTGIYNLNGGTLQIGGNSLLAGYGAGAPHYQFNLGGGTIQVYGSALTTSVNATLTAGSTSTIDTNGLGATFSGVLSGSGALTKAGAGTLLLSGANTYSGATLVGAGTLQAGAAGAFSSASAFTVASGATLDLNGFNQTIGSLAGSGLVNVGTKNLTAGGDNSNTAFSGTISMTNQGYGSNPYGTFLKTGSGTLTIDNATIQLGETYIAQGAMKQTSGNTSVTYLAVGEGVVGSTPNVGALLVSGGTITFGTQLQVGDFGGTGTVTQTGGTVQLIAQCGDITHCAALNIGNQSGNGVYNISGGELDLTAGLNTIGRNTGSHSGSTGALNISGGGVVDLSGNSGGGGGLIIGYGNLNGGALQSQGTITQTGGVLRVHNGSTLYLSGYGASTGVYSLNGGALEIGGDGLKANYGNGQSLYQFNLGGGTIKVIEAALTTSVNATLTAGSTSTIDTNGLGATFSGSLSGGGALAKIGAGTLALLGSNSSYTGGTTIYSGVLQAAANGSIGSGPVTLDGGAFQAGTNGLAFANNFVLDAGAANTIDTQAYSLSLSGGISGAGGFAKQGGGVLILNGASAYQGATDVGAGTLRAGGSGVFAPTSAFTVSTGATLDLNGFNQTIGSLAGPGAVTLGTATLTTGGDGTSSIFSGAISGAGGLVKTGAGTFTLTGANSYTGGTTISSGTLQIGDGGTTGSIAGNVTNNGTLAFYRSDSVTFGGVISGAGALSQFGSGTLILTAANSYTGGTTITSGVLQAAANGSIGSGSVTLDGGAFQVGNNGLAFANHFVLDAGAANTIDTQAFSLSLSGGVSGAGGFAKQGAGVLTLSGASLYTGATSVGAGTLRAGAAGAFAPASAFTVGSGATLDLNGFNQTIGSLSGPGAVTLGAATLTTGGDGTSSLFSGAISGAGGLVKTGTGAFTLTGANSYTGGTTISSGILQIGNGGTTGSIAGDVTNNGTLAFHRSDSVTFGGVISGAGALSQLGSGTLILTAANSYTGGTTISSGTLQIGDGGTTGSIAGNVTNNGTLAFYRSDSVTFGGVISGAGALSQFGSGTLILTAANSFTGGVTLSGGTTAAPTTIGVSNSGALGSGALSLGKAASDVTTLLFNGNGLNIANAITLTGDPAFVVATGSTNTISGAIGGAGDIVADGGGTLILSGANSYTGGTTICGAARDSVCLTANATPSTPTTLQVGSSSALGTGPLTFDGGILQADGNFTIANAGALNASGGTIDANGNRFIYSGAIGNGDATNGQLTIKDSVGGGMVILTGNSSYTGPTSVNGGALVVDGSIASSSLTTVNAGAALAGTGSVGALTINGGGVFAPAAGTPGGSMTVGGNLSFNAGSSYLVTLNAMTSTAAHVQGSASLAGATVGAGYAPGSYLEKRYTILSATGGGIGGANQFAGLVSTSVPSGFHESLSYDSNDVYLNLTANLGALNGGAPFGLPGNQQHVANALNLYFNAGGALPPNFVNLFNLNASTLSSTLATLTGEASTATQQTSFGATNQFFDLIFDAAIADGDSGASSVRPMSYAEDAPVAAPKAIALVMPDVGKSAAPRPILIPRPVWGVWANSFGGYSTLSADPTGAGTHALTGSLFGLASGIEYRPLPGVTLGLALSGGGADWGLAQGLGGGHDDFMQASLYGLMRFGSAYVASAFAFGNHWMDTSRNASGYGLTARFQSQNYAGRIEAGLQNVALFGVSPYVAAQEQVFEMPGYSENDPMASGFALSYLGRSFTDARAEIGARFYQAIGVYGPAVLGLRGRAAYAHDWVSDPTLAAAFAILPGTGFGVEGARPGRNAAVVSLGPELRMPADTTLFAKFDGEFSDRGQTYFGRAGFRWGF
ncbi:hypothetical protein DSM21852_00160 [Methylocystis bryophila]|nr:hypothetical protein DSM21852_00160 [Methylocystis bryophila]